MLNVLSSASTQALYPIPAFNDNYIWLLQEGDQVIVVDPGEAEPVYTFLQKHQLKLAAILITHHHGDHVGGIHELKTHYPAAPVYGPANENIPLREYPVKEGMTFSIPGIHANIQVYDIPGHTRGHVAYFVTPAQHSPMLFCGDTLFSVGCGRLFEGTAVQMEQSLGKLMALPTDTLVCCAHEYTLSNIRWALEIEPNNTALQARYRQATAQRANGQPTLPSTLADELATNPFLRTRESAVIAAAQNYAGRALTMPVDVFTCLREWKNNA